MEIDTNPGGGYELPPRAANSPTGGYEGSGGRAERAAAENKTAKLAELNQQIAEAQAAFDTARAQHGGGDEAAARLLKLQRQRRKLLGLEE
jgi:hypothetical protein